MAHGRVTGVNDILYQYDVTVQESITAQDDFGVIVKLLGGLGVPASFQAPKVPAPCTDHLASAQRNLADVRDAFEHNGSLNPRTDSSNFKSIPLSDTTAAWDKEIAPRLQTFRGDRKYLSENDTACKDEFRKDSVAGQKHQQEWDNLEIKLAPDFEKYIQPIETRRHSEHKVTFNQQVRDCYKYTITVIESYAGVPTKDGTKSFDFTMDCNQLTLSAGALFTTLEARTYRAAQVPNQTQSQLVVEGTGVRPAVAALLNYRIPGLDFDNFGFTVSSGPAIRLGSSGSDTSNIGFFGGVSVHLWHRLFLTPGVHVGEFAGFPAGFTAAGQTIPPNFGTLTPVKRWTARFGFSVTYKALSFDSLKGQSEQKAGKTEGGKSDQKK